MKNDTPETITIQLTKGYTAVIDAVDADLATFKWNAQVASCNITYAVRGGDTISGRPTMLRMHRIILARSIGRELTINEVCDHINGNGLDNRRLNLRIATHSQNMANRRRHSNNTSGHKGVHWDKGVRKWRVFINVDGRRVHVGLFAHIDDACVAYNEAAKIQYGDFATSTE